MTYQGNTGGNHICGTYVTARMCGDHPHVGVAARRKICWEYSDQECYNNNNKNLGSYIDVAGCRDGYGIVFYVYKLVSPGWCELGYCAL